MSRRIVLWIVIGGLFLVNMYLFFKTGTVSAESDLVTNTANVVSSSGMVGGC